MKLVQSEEGEGGRSGRNVVIYPPVKDLDLIYPYYGVLDECLHLWQILPLNSTTVTPLRKRGWAGQELEPMAVEIKFFLASADIRDRFWFQCFPVNQTLKSQISGNKPRLGIQLLVVFSHCLDLRIPTAKLLEESGTGVEDGLL
jgi:hypothetical protein